MEVLSLILSSAGDKLGGQCMVCDKAKQWRAVVRPV